MLSVIMSTKNLDESCLPSISSILAQDVNLELIVVIDAGGKQIVDIKNDCVKIINSPKRLGSHHSLINLGYMETKYNLVTMHDSDDISEPNRFKLLLSKIGNEQAISSYLLVQEASRTTVKEFDSINFIKPADYYKNMMLKTPANHCATIMTRQLWDILGPYDARKDVRADSERMIKMGIYLLLSNSPLKIIKEPLYRYCVNFHSVSQQNVIRFDMQKKQRRMIIKRNWSDIQHMKPQEFLDWWKFRMDGAHDD